MPEIPNAPAPDKTLLPGMAMVAVYMLIVAMVGAFGALNGKFQGGRYVVLPICTLLVIGVFGFLRLRRWGWALVTGGCLCLSLMFLYEVKAMHSPAPLVMGGLNLCLFLYLIRTEVRERLRA